MRLEKPKRILVTVQDRQTNKSKSLTVYDTELEVVYNLIASILKRHEAKK